ncbi:MAG: shikimate kinase [Longimicrobiales bacterium]
MAELPEQVRRIVLIGLMGAGKTTVGQLLAQRLGWTFLDLDAEIEAGARKSVSQIFEDDGEVTFRRLEQQLTGELASRDRVVLAPGGGWVTQPIAVAQLANNTALFWLQVTPEEAVRRVQQDGTVRPLLQVNDPLAAAQRLAQERTHAYERLGVPVETVNRTPSEIVQDIMSNLGTRIMNARAPQRTNG